ncbi:MAG: hypothetical protein HPZ91_08140 [Lentisphaeria bacterium]|nr:hypothetical protein [Lentisphaeria bacterium]
MATTVLVTQLQFDKAKEVFEHAEGFSCLPAPEEEAELARMVRERRARYVVIGGASYRRELYDALPAGGVIARFGVGYDNIDLKLAAEKGILCTNTPGTLEQSVAECTIGMLLLAARRFVAVASGCRGGVWKAQIGCELAGKVLAVAGCGAIGSRVAAIAKNGFGMKVTGLVHSAPPPECPADRFTESWDDAVADADFVSLHIPGSPGNRGFVSAERLARMKRGAWLVNTARGSVVDEAALYDALAAGRIGGAVLDVFQHEPYEPSGGDLRTLPNAVMTPHVGSSTAEACRRMALLALKNIELCERGDAAAMNRIGGL